MVVVVAAAAAVAAAAGEGGGRGRETRSRPDGGGARSPGGRAPRATSPDPRGNWQARPRGGRARGAVCEGARRAPGGLGGLGVPVALLRSSPPSPLSSDSGFHASSHPLPAPATRSGRAAPTLIPGAWPPAWGARKPDAAPGLGAYLAVPLLPNRIHTKLKKKKKRGEKDSKPAKFPLCRFQKQKPLASYTPERARERRAPAEEPLGAGSIQPGMSPQACPGAWRSAPLPLAASSPPRNPRRRGSLTERVNGSAGQGHLGVRRAEEPSRSSAAADAGAVSRQTKPEMAKRSDG